MTKKKITLADGRYLVYYSFDRRTSGRRRGRSDEPRPRGRRAEGGR